MQNMVAFGVSVLCLAALLGACSGNDDAGGEEERPASPIETGGRAARQTASPRPTPSPTLNPFPPIPDGTLPAEVIRVSGERHELSTSFRAQVETTLGVPGLGISSLAEVLWDEGLGTYQETQGYVATQEATEQINFALLEPYSEPANLYVRQFGGPWYHIPKDAPGGPQSAIRNAELALGVVRYGIMVSLLRDVEALDLIEQPYAPGLEAYRGTFDLYDYAESVGTLGTIDADESTLLEGSPPGSVVIWVDHRTGLPYTYEIQLKAESEGFVVFELQQEVFFANHNRYVPIPESPAEAPPLPAGELPA